MRAAFARDDVRGLVRQDLVAGPAMHQRRRDVAHGARRHEHRGLLAQEIGDALAEQVDGRIVADLLVADLGRAIASRIAGGRAGLGVRQQVDADRRRLGIAWGRGVEHGRSRYSKSCGRMSWVVVNDGANFDAVGLHRVEDQV